MGADHPEQEDVEIKRKKLEQEIIAYYDSLTDEEVAEDRAWGEFGAQQLAESYDEHWQAPEGSDPLKGSE